MGVAKPRCREALGLKIQNLGAAVTSFLRRCEKKLDTPSGGLGRVLRGQRPLSKLCCPALLVPKEIGCTQTVFCPASPNSSLEV